MMEISEMVMMKSLPQSTVTMSIDAPLASDLHAMTPASEKCRRAEIRGWGGGGDHVHPDHDFLTTTTLLSNGSRCRTIRSQWSIDRQGHGGLWQTSSP